uniref:E3 ubiquitin-protein ligase BRE1-like 1 isoform X2 n=1 Tax=Rhizophora mucronata TaxID=61149 RepID=A0A2P2JDY1_RHIMU
MLLVIGPKINKRNWKRWSLLLENFQIKLLLGCWS